MQGSSFDLTEKISFPDSQDFLFTSVNNLTLTLGSINVSTQAINDLLLVSDKVRSDITVFTEKPVKHGKLPSLQELALFLLLIQFISFSYIHRKHVTEYLNRIDHAMDRKLSKMSLEIEIIRILKKMINFYNTYHKLICT